MALYHYWRRGAYPIGNLSNINTGSGNPAYRLAIQAATRSAGDSLLRTRFKLRFAVAVDHSNPPPVGWWETVSVQPVASFSTVTTSADPVLSSGTSALVGADMLSPRMTREVVPLTNDYAVTWDSTAWVDSESQRKGNLAGGVLPRVNVGLWVFDPEPALTDFPQYAVTINAYLYLQTLWGSTVAG